MGSRRRPMRLALRGDSRLLPILVAFVLTAAWGAPYVPGASRNPDEDQYAWSAAYYGKRVLHGDFGEWGRDAFLDPGFDPHSYWGRSMGTRWVYALGLALPGVRAPDVPYSYVSPSFQGPVTRLDRGSLLILRSIGLLAAATGAALVALRFGWVGTAAVAVVLAIPHGAENFARAWAEGPLLLAFGLVAAAWGRRWFPVVLGVASTAKLTAIGLWPLLAVRSAHGWRSRALALAACVGVWAVLTPPSWFAYGPGLILDLVAARLHEYAGGQASGGGLLFLPSRYFWPFELAVALAVGAVVRQRRVARVRGLAAARPSVTPDG